MFTTYRYHSLSSEFPIESPIMLPNSFCVTCSFLIFSCCSLTWLSLLFQKSCFLDFSELSSNPRQQAACFYCLDAVWQHLLASYGFKEICITAFQPECFSLMDAVFPASQFSFLKSHISSSWIPGKSNYLQQAQQLRLSWKQSVIEASKSLWTCIMLKGQTVIFRFALAFSQATISSFPHC